MKIISFAAVGLMILLSLYATAYADYKRDIGYTKLETELGGSTPGGSGVVVTQAEAANGDGYWMPDDTDPQFGGKTLIFHTGSFPGEYSNHGTAVGKYFYGNSSSMAPGIATIDCYSADYWLDLDFLRTLNTQISMGTTRWTRLTWLNYQQAWGGRIIHRYMDAIQSAR